MQIVLDTNVLISGLINPKGYPAKVLNLILLKEVNLALDTRIYTEYSEVLLRPKFGFELELVHPLLDFFKSEFKFYNPPPLDVKLPDGDDLMFYELAKHASVLFLVTGNLKHFPNESFIVTPKEFIEKHYSKITDN
jgi:putative PIN family toxin of toxin-antitoxin system